MSRGNCPPKCSVLVCGVPCGKTSLIQRYTHDVFVEDYKPTVKIIPSTITVEVDSEKIGFCIYDSCGSNTTNGMSIGPLLGKDGFIVVYDVTNYESFAHTKSFFDAIRCYANKKTLPILVGNKVDLGSEREVSPLVAEDFAKELNIPYLETSAKDGLHVKELFDSVINNIIKPSEDVLVKQWTPLRQSMACTKCTCIIT